MKKIITFIIIILVIVLTFFMFPKIIISPIKEIIHINKETEEDIINKKVEDAFNKMSLEEKIASMMIIDIQKPELSEEDLNFLKSFKPGGFILFSPNISSYDKTLDMIKQIKATNDIPLFISIDEEGGKVARLDSLKDINVTKVPDMYKVGNTKDSTTAYEVGKIIGNKLGVFGINMDFAPCADVYSDPNNKVIGTRSFASDADTVSIMSQSLAKGLEESNVIAVYKHFPGHGNTSTDSHIGLPILNSSMDTLKQIDLIPFENAIKNNAEVIMVGHLAIPNITGDSTPASLSKVLITDILKNTLNYNNLVITDSLKMGAITNYYTEKEIYEMAINAGVDILLMPKDANKALEIIKESVTKGVISEERINNSVKKILKLKYQKVEENYNNYLPKEYLNNPSYQDILNKIA